MAAFDFSAVGFLVLDILGRPTSELPPPGGATFVDEIRMTVAGTAGGTAMDCGILGLKGQIVTEVGRADAVSASTPSSTSFSDGPCHASPV